jgi:hypothetical protein
MWSADVAGDLASSSEDNASFFCFFNEFCFRSDRSITNQSLRAPCGRAGSVERTGLTGCTRRGSGVGLWRFLPPRVAVEAVG